MKSPPPLTQPADRPAPDNPFGGPAFDVQQLLQILRIIRERWLWGLAAGLLCAGLFLFVTLRKEPVYAASAYLLIESKAEQVIDVEKVIDTSLTGWAEAELENHLRKLTSRKFLNGVIDSFSEAETQRILKPYRNEDVVPGLGQLVGQNLSVTRDKQVFRIESRHRSPEVAALIANRVMAQYVRATLDRTWTGTESARSFLDQQAAELRQRISNAEKELTEYRSRNQLVSLEENQNIIVARLKSINAGLTAARLEQLNLKASVDQVSAADTADMDLTEIPVIARYGAIPDMLGRRKALQSEKAALGIKYLERHPDMIEISQRLALVENQLAAETERAQRDLTNQLEGTNRRIERLETELAASEEAALDLDRMAVEYNVLKRQLDSDRTTFDSIIGRLNETQLAANLDSTNLRILDEAIAPGRPVEPDPRRATTIAAFLFFACFGGLPLLLEAFDNRLKSAYDVETFIGRPLLADLPHLPDLANGTIPSNIILTEENEIVSEAYRAAYSSLQQHSHIGTPKVILVTSTHPSEGKSFFASNLCATLAQHGLRTLLVDTDFRRPTLHRHFDLRNDRGIVSLMDALQQNPDAANSAANNPIEDPHLGIHKLAHNLDFLRAGGSTKKSTQLIDSEPFETLIRSLRNHYDVILLDSPPASLFPDAFFLGDYSDEVLYICRYNKVNRHKVRHFIQKLDGQDHPKVLGVVINGRTSANGHRYGYDYGYGYTYYSSDYKYYKSYADRDDDPPSSAKLPPRSKRSQIGFNKFKNS